MPSIHHDARTGSPREHVGLMCDLAGSGGSFETVITRIPREWLHSRRGPGRG